MYIIPFRINIDSLETYLSYHLFVSLSTKSSRISKDSGCLRFSGNDVLYNGVLLFAGGVGLPFIIMIHFLWS